MNGIIKIIKAITLSLVAVFTVLMIEPLRFFVGCSAVVLFIWLCVDAVREAMKWNS